MAPYFEHLIPAKAPSYMALSVRPRFEEAAARVRSRMDKLEKALDISGLRGEVFSAAVLPLFHATDSYGDPIMDSMTANELAQSASLLAIGHEDEPDRMVWPNCLTLVDTAFVQNSEWETLRMLGIGGSDSANINNSGYGTAQKVYYDKVGGLPEESKDAGKQFIFDYGHKMEPLVIDEFCRRSGAQRIKETRMFCHKEHPELTANIDQIVQMPDGRLFVFEAKTTTSFNKDAWAGGAVPRHYVPQCHKYPIVLNDDRICGTYIGCIYGNTPDQFACSFIERDLAAESEQMNREVAWWHDYVLAGVEPPPSNDPDRDKAITNRKAGKGNPDAAPVDLDADDYAEMIDYYLQLQESAQDLTRKLNGINRNISNVSRDLILALGESYTGTCVVPNDLKPDDAEYEYIVSNKPRKQVSVDKERLRLSYPEAYAACVKEDPQAYRVFSVKLKKKARKK